MSESETPKKPEKETNDAQGNQTINIINRPSTPGDWRKVKSLGWFLFVVPLIIVFLIYVLWPTIAEPRADVSQKGKSAPSQQVQKTTDTTGTSQAGNPDDSSSPGETGQEQNLKKEVKWSKKMNIFGWEISFQLRMIILVFLCGALGSYIHMATSFTYHIGFNTFDMDWLWWYWLRMPIGGVLALIFSLLIQGGVFAALAAGSESQPVTLIGLAALVGMFSRQATEKLREVFDVVFKTKEGEENRTRKKAGGKTTEKDNKDKEEAAT
jgi:hypothetical protein